MTESNWELWAIIITIIEFNINFYVYSITKSPLDILTIIVASIILGLIFIISHIYLKLNKIINKQEEFNKRLNNIKELEDIRLDLKEIKGYQSWKNPTKA